MPGCVIAQLIHFLGWNTDHLLSCPLNFWDSVQHVPHFQRHTSGSLQSVSLKMGKIRVPNFQRCTLSSLPGVSRKRASQGSQEMCPQPFSGNRQPSFPTPPWHIWKQGTLPFPTSRDLPQRLPKASPWKQGKPGRHFQGLRGSNSVLDCPGQTGLNPESTCLEQWKNVSSSGVPSLSCHKATRHPPQ